MGAISDEQPGGPTWSSSGGQKFLRRRATGKKSYLAKAQRRKGKQQGFHFASLRLCEMIWFLTPLRCPLFGIVEDEKTALDMAAQDLVPHYQGVSLAKGVAEPDLLARGKRCVRVRGSEAAL